MRNKQVAIAVTTLLIAGCGTSPVESEFGNSVRQMRDAQTLDREALAHPSDAPVIGADPYVVETAVEGMRKDVPKREETQRDVIINLGGGAR